jgi:hypothetical protein
MRSFYVTLSGRAEHRVLDAAARLNMTPEEWLAHAAECTFANECSAHDLGALVSKENLMKRWDMNETQFNAVSIRYKIPEPLYFGDLVVYRVNKILAFERRMVEGQKV